MVLSSKDSVKSRKKSRCCLCGELINVGDIKATRSGIGAGTAWTMNMHPECKSYESKPGVVDIEWYEDVSEPAFARSAALVAPRPPKSPAPRLCPRCGNPWESDSDEFGCWVCGNTIPPPTQP